MAEADSLGVASNGAWLHDLPPEMLDSASLRASNIVGFNSADKDSRPFNLLRTQLLKRLDGSGPHLVGVTSAAPAAGKSFLAANLAASLSRVSTGATCLVDLDMRRGSVATELGIDVAAGVSDYLSGQVKGLAEIGRRLDTLTVFPTRVVSADSAELIAGESFQALTGELRRLESGSVVVFDLPPVFATDDAALAMRALDAFLMVVDAGRTTRRQLESALGMLHPTPCIGTVLNRYAGGVLDSYGYGSSKYDKYYQN